MQLVSLTLNGYRRFREESKLILDGKLVALVGPNEAGKSSALKALLELSNEDPLTRSGADQSITRKLDIPEDQKVILARCALDGGDRVALSSIPGAEAIRWYTLSKDASENPLTHGISPRIKRDLRPRKTLRKKIEDWLSNGKPTKLFERATLFDEGETIEEATDKFRNLQKILDTESQSLKDSEIQQLDTVASCIEKNQQESDPKYIQKTVDQIRDLSKFESEEHPENLVLEILENRFPKFALFSDEARQLASEYDISGEATELPKPLENLFSLGGIDPQDLLASINSDDFGKRDTIIERGNEDLSDFFKSAWSQSELTVRLSVNEFTVRVQVGNLSSEYESLNQRSDGLRQFVALMAFLFSSKSTDANTIVLIDEAETHLHYDAQADLIQTLTQQPAIEKVIYTTHSMGCLPEDLGTGIRMVAPIGISQSSKFDNWFWCSDRPGFGPLLFGMGASTLAFLPMRKALIAEGASDHILLPTLLRDANKRNYLGFQIVPGLAEVTSDQIPVIENESPTSVFLTDSDDGGKGIRKKLKRTGISDERIFSLQDSNADEIVLEDFVDAAIYAEAVNEELRRSHGLIDAILVKDLTDVNMPGKVRALCEAKGVNPPGKRAVVYRILELRSEGKEILNSSRIGELQALYMSVISYFSS